MHRDTTGTKTQLTLNGNHHIVGKINAYIYNSCTIIIVIEIEIFPKCISFILGLLPVMTFIWQRNGKFLSCGVLSFEETVTTQN